MCDTWGVIAKSAEVLGGNHSVRSASQGGHRAVASPGCAQRATALRAGAIAPRIAAGLHSDTVAPVGLFLKDAPAIAANRISRLEMAAIVLGGVLLIGGGVVDILERAHLADQLCASR